jgi:hypothetical protein
MSNLQNRARNRGRSNEYRLVEKLKKMGHEDAERVPLSGALAKMKGDVKVPSLKLLLEAKVYAVTSVAGTRYARFDFNWVDKATKEAKNEGYDWSAVVFRGENLQKDYAVMPFEDYVRLVEIATSAVKEPQPEILEMSI